MPAPDSIDLSIQSCRKAYDQSLSAALALHYMLLSVWSTNDLSSKLIIILMLYWLKQGIEVRHVNTCYGNSMFCCDWRSRRRCQYGSHLFCLPWCMHVTRSLTVGGTVLWQAVIGQTRYMPSAVTRNRHVQQTPISCFRQALSGLHRSLPCDIMSMAASQRDDLMDSSMHCLEMA